ncbi:MAG: lipocalin family protein [Cyclobacteriaceae bacterium]|nr:lipocalin family protein [Cyclobacteriaceae bacterium]
MMNKSLTCAILVLFIVTGCSKKDDPATPSIVGTWVTTSATTSACEDPNDNGTEICASSCNVYEYKADGTGTITNSSGTLATFTYSVSGTTLTTTVTYAGGGAPASGTYQITVTATTLTRVYEDAASGGLCTFTWTYARQ